MVREGNQEGTAKGYNPKRPGRPSHHPLLAFVSDVRMIASYWLRPGNTVANTNCLAFLEDTLSRLENKTVGLVRMDSGFFTKEILDFLEYKNLHYIIAYRFNNRIKYSLTHEHAWVEVANGLEISETTYQANGWDQPRHIWNRSQNTERPNAAANRSGNWNFSRTGTISANTVTAVSSPISGCRSKSYTIHIAEERIPRTGSRN